jgi:methionyl aminopeptidase
MEINTEVLEKTGPAFSVDALMSARSKTKEAISMIAHSVKPGMLEEEAR